MGALQKGISIRIEEKKKF